MQVELEEHDGSGGGVRRVALTVRGLTPAGYLLATDSAGARFELHPDGNRRAHRAAPRCEPWLVARACLGAACCQSCSTTSLCSGRHNKRPTVSL